MGDTPHQQSDGSEGGAGWRVREPSSRRPQRAWDAGASGPPTPPQPLSTAPPGPPPPSGAQPPAAPPPPWATPTPSVATALRPHRKALVYGLCALALFGVAGGGAVVLSSGHSGTSGAAPGGSASSPAGGRASLLAAVQRVEGGSMRADIKLTESFSATGAGGARLGAFPGGDVTLTIHIDQASANRSELRETVEAFGVKQTLIAVLYDGTVYVSQNNGASYQTVTVDQAATHLVSPKSPLAFLEMIGDVKPVGDVEVNGVTAASYHATLDPVKLDAYLKNSLATAGSADLDKILNNVGVTDGTLDAAVDPNGNLLSETGAIDAAVDLGAFSPADAGSTLDVHEGFSGAFSDYGSSIDITKPGGVTGPMTL